MIPLSYWTASSEPWHLQRQESLDQVDEERNGQRFLLGRISQKIRRAVPEGHPKDESSERLEAKFIAR